MAFLTFFIIFQLINIISSLSFLDQSLPYLNSPFLKFIINKKNLTLNSFNNKNYDNYLYINSSEEDEERTSLKGRFLSLVRDELEITNISQSSVSKGCINIFNRYLFGHIDKHNSSNISYLLSNYHLTKLLDDSSKSRNYLGTYDQCMIKRYKYNISFTNNEGKITPNYIVMIYDHTANYTQNYYGKEDVNFLRFEFDYYLIALCLPQGKNNESDNINKEEIEYCTDNDYELLVRYINEKIGDYLHFENTTFYTFTLRNNPGDNEKDSNIYIFLCLLPFLFFAFQSFFVIFRNPIIFIFQKIYLLIKKPKKDNIENKKDNIMEDDSLDNDDEDERVSYIRNKENNIENNDNKLKEKLIYKITNCFCFTENQNELFNFDLTSTKYNNDSGLSNVRGIKGISIFLMIVGWTFIALFNSPAKVYSPFHIKNYFEKEYISSSLVMIGVRYAPRIIISCSGYILIYKYISYLDRNVINNSVGFLCIKFIFYQSHKYILLILLLLFQRYSLYQIFRFDQLGGETPLWKYFHLFILSKPSIGQFIYSFFLIRYFGPSIEEESRKGNNILHYFWLPFNEIFFFIIGVLLITIGFKKKYRIDIIILILIPIIFIVKIIYSFLIVIFYESNDKIPLKKIIPTYYFSFFNYGKFMINPLFNLPYFFIGMYFGLMNYTIQKGIFKLNKTSFYSNNTKKNENDNESSQEDSDYDITSSTKTNNISKEEEEENKNIYSSELTKMPFLITPVIFVQWHRKQNIIHLLILILIFVILFFFFIILYYCGELKYILENTFINIIYRIDIEFIVLFVHWGAFIIFLKANNFAAIFLGHVFWTMLTKPYFSFILIINSILLFIFYHSETLIEINSMNIFLYSLIGGTVTFIFTILFYIFYELPYKRLIHLIFSLRNESENSENDDKERKDSYENIDEENEEEEEYTKKKKE